MFPLESSLMGNGTPLFIHWWAVVVEQPRISASPLKPFFFGVLEVIVENPILSYLKYLLLTNIKNAAQYQS
jgi:hypothetical protein